MIDGSDVNLDSRSPWLGHLGVAFEAEIVVSFHQHLGVDGSMRAMASGAAFAHGLVLIDMHLSLLAVAGDARLVLARHSQASGRLHEIQAVGIVALDAVHLSLGHRMMVGKVELSLGLKMALVAGLRVVAWIGDELAPASARLHVQASWPVAGLTAVERALSILTDLNLRVTAHRKTPGNVGVAFEARLIANEMSPLDMRRNYDGSLDGPTGAQSETGGEG